MVVTLSKVGQKILKIHFSVEIMTGTQFMTNIRRPAMMIAIGETLN